MILRRGRERDEHREGTEIDRVVRRREKKIFFVSFTNTSFI